MKPWSGVLLIVAALTVACSTSMDDERQGLMVRDRDFSRVVKDIDKLLSFYAPEASLYLPGMPVATGAESIRSAALKFAEVPGFSIEWEPSMADAGASRDLAFTTGTYRMTRDVPGKSAAVSGTYVEVWKKSGGDWKVVEHIIHPSSD